jgi:hypothetical protein
LLPQVLALLQQLVEEEVEDALLADCQLLCAGFLSFSYIGGAPLRASLHDGFSKCSSFAALIYCVGGCSA